MQQQLDSSLHCFHRVKQRRIKDRTKSPGRTSPVESEAQMHAHTHTYNHTYNHTYTQIHIHRQTHIHTHTFASRCVSFRYVTLYNYPDPAKSTWLKGIQSKNVWLTGTQSKE